MLGYSEGTGHFDEMSYDCSAQCEVHPEEDAYSTIWQHILLMLDPQVRQLPRTNSR